MKKNNLLQTVLFLMTFALMNQFANAQTCPAGQVYACRYKGNCTQECKCIDSTKVVAWTLHGHNCNGYCNCSQKGCWLCGLRLSDNELSEKTELFIYPNPVSPETLGSTTISFSLLKSQNISFKIFDINGRLVSTLTEKVFDEGEHELVWNASDINAGIYFLQFQSSDDLQMEKLIVSK